MKKFPYFRTILVFFLWLIAMAVALSQEEVSPVNIAIGLVALVMWQLIFGFRLDKAAQKREAQRLEKERLKREEIGEEAWQAQQAEQQNNKKAAHRIFLVGLLIDLAVGGIYITIRSALAGNIHWLKREMANFLAFLFLFYIPAAWLGYLPRTIRKKRYFEAILICPFFLLAFSPLTFLHKGKLMIPCILFTLGWEFTAMGIGYILQERKKGNTCNMPATAKVVGNVKSMMHSPGERHGYIPTYQPVLEYYANGAMRQVVCDNGQPRPLPLGKVFEIYYHPEKPEEFRFDEDEKPSTDKYGGYIFAGIGVVILIVAVVLFFVL